MKFSDYLNIIRLSDKNVLIYDSFSESYIGTKLESPVDFSSPDTLRNDNPELYNLLLKNGSIIDNNIDLASELKKRIDKTDNADDSFQLHINPTLDCNFNCWYCYENHIKDSRMSPEIIEITKKAIDKITGNENLKSFTLSFFGGEPLLEFDNVCVPLAEYAIEKCNERKIKFSSHFTSNAYLLTDEIINKIKGWNVGFQITLDGEKEKHDNIRFPKGGGGSFDTIIDNIRNLLHNGIEVVLRFNYTDDSLENISSIIPIISRIPENERKLLSMDFQRVWQDFPQGDYLEILDRADEISESFMDLGISIRKQRLLNHVCDSCYGDKRNYALINFNGDLFSCTARDFTKANRSGYLSDSGDLIWENDSKNKRMQKKFFRKICQTCGIAPICGGACRQNHIEHPEDDFCIHGSGEERIRRIEDIILTRFDTFYIPKQENK